MPFLIGGLVIVGLVVALVITGTVAGGRFFITVDEVVNDGRYAMQSVRVSGAVLGESIRYDAEALVIEFTVANIPSQFDDLATALHQAVNNPDATLMHVRIENAVKPELLQHEAQAILTGRLMPDGVFHATDLNLKCPTRFTEAGPMHGDVMSSDTVLPENHPVNPAFAPSDSGAGA
jgi:cytochrome c-type biogenesis protein CcmE